MQLSRRNMGLKAGGKYAACADGEVLSLPGGANPDESAVE
jgi:hypothetical protein